MERREWTIGALLRWTADHFAKKGVESPRLDAEVLLSHVLNCRRIELYTRSEELTDESARSRFRSLIERRIAGCPVAYLVGMKEFFLLPFEVSPAVLIPRPATETLVMAALEHLKPLESAQVLDLGTGSGCIAISLAVQLKSIQVVATDTEAATLEIAGRNAAKHGVAARIDFRRGDLYGPVAGERFAAIVSNPPYIPTDQLAALATDVRDHEPRAALDGGPDGLAVIQSIVAGAAKHLTPGGRLFVEIGLGQDAAVRHLLGQTANLIFEKTIPDGDGIPRVIAARLAQ
jgi:release factor glutamine methyltransferase